MSRNINRLPFIGKIITPAFIAGTLVLLSTMNGCSPSDHSTESRDDTVAQNAAEAEAAEAQVASKDKAAETNSTLTKTDKKDAKVAQAMKKSRHPANAGGVYVVQIGAFKVKENADKLETKLKTAGFDVSTRTIDHSKNGLLHLVQFAPTSNRAEAETQIEELQAKQDLTAQILVMPSAPQ